MHEADGDAAELQRPGLAQEGVVGLPGAPAGAVLAVAARGPEGRDPRQFVKQPQLVDVAPVEDGVDPGEGVERLRPEFGARLGDVGVGDEADAHARSLRDGGDWPRLR